MPDHFTTRLALPYPDIDDPADVPTDMQQLANRLDAVVGGVTVSSAVGEVGMAAQVRAGRQLTAADFTVLGLSAPRGLWNLSDLTDASGNGRNLTNKNAVTFAAGINGAAATAAQFRGASGTPANDPALYIADTGAADPFRISTGSWGCWFRTAKRGTVQALIGKSQAQRSYELSVNTNNVFQGVVSQDGSTVFSVPVGSSDVADDRWHFGVLTHDGTVVRAYVDGVLEATALAGFLAFTAAAPLNIGARQADGTTPAIEPHYGRVDEAFVSADVLSEDQVRALYAARIIHTLGATPKVVGLNVRRARRGAALVPTDFTTAPVRLYNFTAGALTDQGSGNVPLVNAGTAPLGVTGADGTVGNALSFGAVALAHLTATDAGLPSALLARSYGCWFKTAVTTGDTMLSWGTISTADVRLRAPSGIINANNGADGLTGTFVADGQWHHVMVVEDNTAADGVKRKMYLDGRVVANSTVMNAITLAGASRFRIGAASDGTLPFVGQIDRVVVTAYAITTDEVLRLYAKGAQPLAGSPKNAGDHVEAFDSGSLLFIGDTLDAPHSIDLTVS